MMKFITVLGFSLTLAACGHKQTKFDSMTASNGSGDKSVSASLEWVKNKSHSIDALVKIVNHTDAGVKFYGSDNTLAFGGETVAARQEGGDLRLSAGVRSQLILIFPIEGKKAGPAELTIVPHDLGDKPLAPLKFKFEVEADR